MKLAAWSHDAVQIREKLRAAIKKGQGIEKEKNAALQQIQELQQRVQQLEEDVAAAKCVYRPYYTGSNHTAPQVHQDR